MNILMITSNDPAGMGITFANAINRFTEHTCRLITTETRYNFDFKKDIHIPDLKDDDFEEVKGLLKDADIFHFHILSDENMTLGPLLIRNYIKGKNIIHHQHGHPDFKANPEKYRNKYRHLGRRVIVSTPNLLKLIPEAVLVPNVVPINDPLFKVGQMEDDNDIIRICQSPTRRDLKNTDDFLAVMKELEAYYPNVEDVIIENTPHKDCLRIKRNCQIAFDHMQGYYGVSSLESLSQGIPTIAGLDDWNIKAILEFTGVDYIPWIIARGKEELKNKLVELIEDPGLRKDVGARSRDYMEKYWTEQRVLQILLNVYESF